MGLPAAVDTPTPSPVPLAVPPPARSFRQRLVSRFFDVYLTADVRSLAAGRIVMSAVLLLDLFKRWALIDSFYTNEGLIPNHTLLWRPGFEKVFSFFFMASYRYEATAAFVVIALAYVALLVGFRTRLAQVASFVGLISLHGRLLLFDNGGDVVLGLLCAWTMFLPTGRVWSVDSVLARCRSDRNRGSPAWTSPTTRFGRTAVNDGLSGKAMSLGVLAVTFQLALIYFFNAVHKQGPTWREGSAVYYTLHLDRLATWFAVWLRGWIPPWLARDLSYGTLSIEWSLPFLLLSPFAVRSCRRLAILLVVALHTGFASCLNLGIFVPAMIAYTPNFVHSADWDALERWWGRNPRRAAWRVRLAKRLAAPIEHLAAACSPGRTITLSSPGRLRTAFLRRLPLGRELVAAFFIMIAANQVLDENWAAHRVIDHHNPAPIAAAVTYLNLFQGWSMFAPDAPTTDFNIVVQATTADGREVDPFNEVANPKYPKPWTPVPSGLGTPSLFYGYENHLPSRPAYFHALEEWILRYPQRTGRPTDQIMKFRVFKVEDDSPPLGERTPRNPRSELLFQYPP